MSYYYGIDIGGTSVKMAIIDVLGHIIAKDSLDTQPERGFEDLTERLVLRLKKFQTEFNLVEPVQGVGVGIPGFLNRDKRILVESPNIPWHNLPLFDVLEHAFGTPVAIDNDANVAALGEAFAGGGRGAKIVLAVTVGTGVGGGLVIHDELIRGANGMACEIGHMVVKPQGKLCGCGNYGCLETLSSATALIRDARARQAAGDIQSANEIRGAADVFLLASTGDVAAQEVINDAAHWLGYSLAAACAIINPDAIVIGGGVSAAGDAWLTPVREAFQSYALVRVQEAAQLRLAVLGNDAGVVGAARLAAQGQLN